MARNKVPRHLCFALSSRMYCTAFILATNLACFGTTPSLLLAQDTLLPVLHFSRLSTADGLPSNHIRARIVRDHLGYVWIGTVNGLVRYDGYGSKVYRNVSGDPDSYASRGTNSILLDTKNRLWVGGWEQGLSLYDRSRDRFLNFAPGYGFHHDYQPAPTTALYEDRSGDLWLGTEGGGTVHVAIPDGIEDLDSLAAALRFTTSNLGTRRNSAADIYQRSDGMVLIASDNGVIAIEPETHSLSRLQVGGRIGGRLDSIAVQRFLEDSHGNLWVASATEGVFRLDRDGKSIRNYQHRKDDPRSIRSNVVWDIVEAPDGRLWVGTQEGVDIFSAESGQSIPYLSMGPFPGVSVLTRISFDRTGIAWIGTGTDGVYRWSPQSLRISHYSLPRHDGNPRMFQNVEKAEDGTLWLTSEGSALHLDAVERRVLKSIDVFGGKKEPFTYDNNNQAILDKGSVLWWGTWGLGLYRVDLATGEVKNYTHDSPFGRSNIAISLARGTSRSIWTAAYTDGLMMFDPPSGTFRSVPTVAGSNLTHILKDRAGRLWLASETMGIEVYDPKTEVEIQYASDPADSSSLSQNRTRATYQDPQGRIWVGAGNALNLWDSTTGSFTRFVNRAYPNALFNLPIGADRGGKLWVSFSFGGLSIFDPLTGTFTNFEVSDGTCGYITDMENLVDGRVVLTGEFGLNIVDPNAAPSHRPPPPLHITRMAINDEATAPPELTDGSGSLLLTHTQNVLEMEFAAIDMEAPLAVEYRCRLAGLETDWVPMRNRRYVRYTGLSPGEYTFEVKATSARREWSDREISLAISIAFPWWRTRWAYAAYGLFALGMLYGAYRLRLNHYRLKQRAEMEHLQAQHVADVDRLKSRFFANISHEFRTPLTLILGPLQKWREKAHEEAEERDLSMAERNTHRLLGLVNQLLDLSKLEAGAMHVRAHRMNIVPFVKGIANSFESSAGMRGISLHVIADPEGIEVYFDRDMLEKILVNLLSNAFRFTPEGGRVSVSVDAGAGAPKDFVQIVVRDTGIGIPPGELPRLFDRFYQVENSQRRAHEGSGIGLALVKELVELHHGTIHVESVVGSGSDFTVLLPLGRQHFRDDEIDASPDQTPLSQPRRERSDPVPEPPANGYPAGRDEAGGGRPVVLVVEDNPDVRAYTRDHLIAEYLVLEAPNGVEGASRARESIPDLIICDIMMPQMDGYELCRILKHDEKTSHIPMILLTAKAGSEHRIEGLETGADDYLTKPFEPRELLARVRNLIAVRKRLREHFKVPLRPSDIPVTSMDDAFLRKAVEAVEIHMADERFGVEELGAELAMSRVQLYRKVNALTNRPPGEFIRYLRLHRAMELLKKNAGTVSEIAYMVGYGDPSHFARRFRELFGMAPSEVRKQAEKPSSHERHPPHV